MAHLIQAARGVRDDTAYIAPMAVFLAFVLVGTTWPALYPYAYVARTLVVAAMLIRLRPHYTPIRWNDWPLGLVMGVVGFLQWVPMQLWLQNHVWPWPRLNGLFSPPDAKDVFDPFRDIHSHLAAWAFILTRVAGATLVVPVMEELFWRDYLWRQIIAPADFKLARVGEWDLQAFVIVSLAFCLVHGNWWPTAIVWGLMVGGLLLFTRSLGACILMHACTNLILGVWVVGSHQWSFW